jgi:general transcription factor 3C polypeptide 3 (transcription factor C subunit 4)
VDLLLEVIRQVPNLSDPYHTLGALHEVMDQPRQALNFYMIAAHMSGKVSEHRRSAQPNERF